MTTIILISIAGLFKAIKDRLDNPFTKHVFPTWGTFWVKGTGKPFLGWYFDMWHVADLIYITCFCVALALNYQAIPYGVALNALLYFSCTQITFNIFYFIFKKR